jgi:hypothetical protein
VKPSRAPFAVACLVLATSLLACGGTATEPVPAAVIVVPNAAGARTIPGGSLSFEGACANLKLPVTHAWDFPGGEPSSSTSFAGVVRFPSAGSFTIGYRCTGADGKVSPPATRTIAVAPAGPSQVHFQPQYLSTTAEAVLGAAVDAAVAILSSVVTGPTPGLDGSEAPWSDCGNVPITTHVGEVRVLVSLQALDGVGGMVALSSPCYIRTSDGLPYVGLMRIDEADAPFLSAQRLRATITHELMHVLGFGTTWDQSGLPLLISGQGTSNPFFAGPNARAAFRDFDGGAGYQPGQVPLENTGGAGSRDRHWRATIFSDELMTAYLGTSSPLSRTTLEAFVDQGWQVNAELADPFVISTASYAGLLMSAEPVVDLGDDALPIVPRYR